MNAYTRLLKVIYQEDGLTKKQLAASIGIAPATLNRVLANATPSLRTHRRIKRFFKQRQKQIRWDFFMSITIQQAQQFIAVTVVPHEQVETLQLNRLAFPFGWTPGDQLNAQTKSAAQLRALLLALKVESMERYLLVVPTQVANLLYPQTETLLPYWQACSWILQHYPRGGGIQLNVAAGTVHLDNAEIKASLQALAKVCGEHLAQEPRLVLMTPTPARSLGLQASALDAYSASFFNLSACRGFGLRVAEIKAPQLELISAQLMLTVPVTPMGKRSRLRQFKRLYTLVNQVTRLAVSLPKSFKNALQLQFSTLPQPVKAVVSGMPFQNWFDLSARLAMVLSFGVAMQPEVSLPKKFIAQIDELESSLAFLEVSADE